MSSKADSFLRQIPPACRSQVQEIVRRWGEEETALDACFHVLPPLLREYPGPAQEAICSNLLTLLQHDSQGALAFLRSLPTLLAHLSWRDLSRWVEQGILLLQENRSKGYAFFALTSLSSQQTLQRLGRIAYLQDLRRVLYLYVTGLVGTSIPIRSLSELPPAFRTGELRRATTDGEAIYLPAAMDQGASYEENCTLLKVAAAHQAGHFEFGTFRFSLEKLSTEYPDLDLPLPEPRDGIQSDFEKFFRCFPQRSLAQDIFAVLEEGRIEQALRRTYRGLHADLLRATDIALALRPDIRTLPLQQAVVELLTDLVLERDPPQTLPLFLLPILTTLKPMVNLLSRPAATVQETAAATVRVYRIIERLPNLPLAVLLTEPGLQEEMYNLWARFDFDTAMDRLSPSLAPLLTGAEEPYQGRTPLVHQGEIKPELVQQRLKVEALQEQMQEFGRGYIPPEILRELLERGIDIQIRGVQDQPLDTTSGLFVTDLEGRGVGTEGRQERLQEEVTRLAQQIQDEARKFQDQGTAVYYYDEWDYQIQDYRSRWCQLWERIPAGEEAETREGDEDFVTTVLEEHGPLVKQLRKQFQLLKPETFKKMKRLEDGEEIDLDAVVEALVDRRIGLPPSEKIYTKRNKRERSVATAFLLDISASTDDPISEEEEGGTTQYLVPPRHEKSAFSGFIRDEDFYAPLFAQDKQRPKGKRIIDVEREAVVVMAEALESIGDEYAIYAFSGYGRDNVEFFILKEFEEAYSPEVRRRIGALKPQRSTRMGPAIRHVLRKFTASQARIKTLLLLSDGYPQDFDYGKDRQSKVYGIQDTMRALQEGREQGIHTFCITVDRSGKDYLKEMCGEGNYVVIEEVSVLPRELPNIYRHLTT
ncbi:MAG: hypothetical protein D6736_04850 [Nitrospinota bacterium]|nr:MAG: hypothetical protein D6736_04850 [Nitrospinota bacterium]